MTSVSPKQITYARLYTIPCIAGNAAGHRAPGTIVDPAQEHQKFRFRLVQLTALCRNFWCSKAGSTIVPGARCSAALPAMHGIFKKSAAVKDMEITGRDQTHRA